MLGGPCGNGQTFGPTKMSSGAKRDVREGEVQQVGIPRVIPVVSVATVVRRGELLRLTYRPPGTQDRNLSVNGLCQFAHRATSRSAEGALGDRQPRTDRPHAGAERSGRIARRSASRPFPQDKGQSPIFRADFCGVPQSVMAEAVGTTRTPP
jgi:hypothetical protein